ncbi:MAG: polysaccharide deacetylase family protein [Candidatus Hodarchaeota archaeon]
MAPKLFAKRLAWLCRHKFKVLNLGEAIHRLQTGKLRRKTAVITIDDGFYSFYKYALLLLKQFNYPATIYITTYYVIKENPIFRLVVQYVFWKTKVDTFVIDGMLPQLKGRRPTKGQAARDLMWQIIDYGERELTECQRVEVARKLCERLALDYGCLRNMRQLSLMNQGEITQLAKTGIDLQLHTHRHNLPADLDQLDKEINENREILEPLKGKPLEHLCYPSGIWDSQHWKLLKNLGIKTATTSDLGLNKPETHLFRLHRFLDRNDITELEFEAEMFGFKELLRSIKNKAGTWPIKLKRSILERNKKDIASFSGLPHVHPKKLNAALVDKFQKIK